MLASIGFGKISNVHQVPLQQLLQRKAEENARDNPFRGRDGRDRGDREGGGRDRGDREQKGRQ